MTVDNSSRKSGKKSSKREQSQQPDTSHDATQLQSYLMDIQSFELVSQGEASYPIDMSAQMAA